MENADYLTTHKDYSESVDALERAIATLKKQAYDRTQLLQVMCSSLNFSREAFLRRCTLPPPTVTKLDSFVV